MRLPLVGLVGSGALDAQTEARVEDCDEIMINSGSIVMRPHEICCLILINHEFTVIGS